jgi:hypothetical protein
MSSSRSRRILHRRPVRAAATAAAHATIAAWLSLPPKPPPMRPAMHRDLVHVPAERPGDEVLHLGGMLASS